MEEKYRSEIRLRTARRLCCHVRHISVAERLRLIISVFEMRFPVYFHLNEIY